MSQIKQNLLKLEVQDQSGFLLSVWWQSLQLLSSVDLQTALKVGCQAIAPAMGWFLAWRKATLAILEPRNHIQDPSPQDPGQKKITMLQNDHF